MMKQLHSLLKDKKIQESYLFGSVAAGTQNSDSDLDMIIVMDTPLPFFDRHQLFPELYRLGVSLDLLIYTPEEFKKLKSEGENSKVGFWSSVVKQMVKIYP